MESLTDRLVWRLAPHLHLHPRREKGLVIMNKFSAVVVFGVFASIVACAAPATEETDGSEGGEALSAATCTPRAEAAKQKSIAACKAQNSTLDWAGCMKPSNDALAAYNAQLATAYANVKSTVDSVTASCKTSIDGMSADAIVSAAQPKASDYAHAAMVADAKQVATLRDQRKAKCDVDAKDDLADRLGEDDEYVQLLNQNLSHETSYGVGVVKCSALSVGSYVANASCTGLVAYQQTWAACRKECKTPPTAACSPSDYGNRNVPCGKLVNNKSFSLFAISTTCEEVNHCERTPVCDAYDHLIDNGHGEACSSDGKNGTAIATLQLDSKTGAAKSASLVCHTAN